MNCFCGNKTRHPSAKYCSDLCRQNKQLETGMEKLKINPSKHKCWSLATRFPEHIFILYECRCTSEVKHNHHFDYSRPFEVIRLCPKCHRIEHKRLKNINIS